MMRKRSAADRGVMEPARRIETTTQARFHRSLSFSCHAARAASPWPEECVSEGVNDRRSTTSLEGASVLLCDEDRESAAPLAAALEDLGHDVTIVCSCCDAFSAACAHDYDVLVAAPFLRDGATLLLPRALGIRRPRLMLLMTRMSERLSPSAAQRAGFDAQLTRVVDARKLDRVVRNAAAAATTRVAVVEAQPVLEEPAPVSEIGARLPR
jgi:CheY-like chemotaxis protein